MKKHIILVSILITFGFIFYGCESEKEIDNLIKEYVKEKYNTKIKIIEREDVHEGNMGDRTFVVKSKNNPSVLFHVYLEGMFNSKVSGDDYKIQKNAILLGEKFLNENKKTTEKLGISQLNFTDNQGLVISIETNSHLNLYDDKSLEGLIQFIQLVNSRSYLKPYQGKTLLLKLDYLEMPLEIHNIELINNSVDLTYELVDEIDFINYSLFKRDFNRFDALRKGIEQRGYKLEYGMTIGSDKTFFCWEDDLMNGECTGGYSLDLLGGKTDKQSLFELISFLKNQDINIGYIYFQDHDIYFEIKDINTIDDIIFEK
jgi:hypothetical protein